MNAIIDDVNKNVSDPSVSTQVDIRNLFLYRVLASCKGDHWVPQSFPNVPSQQDLLELQHDTKR